MKFFASAVLALSSAAVALAQTANPFNVPASGYSTTAGQTINLSWTPTTQGTVTLLLRTGDRSNLGQGTPIASNIQNSGSFSWSVPTSTVNGGNYAIEIVDDSNSNNVNYTPQFSIQSSNLSYSSASGSATASASASASSASASASSVLSSVSSALSSASASSSAAASSSASASASGMTTSGASSSSATGSASATTSSSSIASAGIQTTSSKPASGAAPRATAMAGVIGAMALGALAL